MRPQKINSQELIEKVVGLFRNRGFAGTSLSDLSEVTGLKKASLYHRFPGGKEEMGYAVLTYTSNWVRNNILKELNDSPKLPLERLNRALEKITEYYDGGHNPCLFRSLTMEMGEKLFEKELHDDLLRWLGGLTKIGVDFGFSYKESEEKAMQVMISLQGSLVICKTLRSTKPFKDTISLIRKMYTN